MKPKKAERVGAFCGCWIFIVQHASRRLLQHAAVVTDGLMQQLTSLNVAFSTKFSRKIGRLEAFRPTNVAGGPGTGQETGGSVRIRSARGRPRGRSERAPREHGPRLLPARTALLACFLGRGAEPRYSIDNGKRAWLCVSFTGRLGPPVICSRTRPPFGFWRGSCLACVGIVRIRTKAELVGHMSACLATPHPTIAPAPRSQGLRHGFEASVLPKTSRWRLANCWPGIAIIGAGLLFQGARAFSCSHVKRHQA